ncbi:hypothetical protein BC828DRAFT_377271 [Blastocladiella britannica]|nr:hypothetical protein BC828DRAFT_377271 [Blastocladiella britannica]
MASPVRDSLELFLTRGGQTTSNSSTAGSPVRLPTISPVSQQQQLVLAQSPPSNSLSYPGGTAMLMLAQGSIPPTSQAASHLAHDVDAQAARIVALEYTSDRDRARRSALEDHVSSTRARAEEVAAVHAAQLAAVRSDLAGVAAALAHVRAVVDAGGAGSAARDAASAAAAGVAALAADVDAMRERAAMATEAVARDVARCEARARDECEARVAAAEAAARDAMAATARAFSAVVDRAVASAIAQVRGEMVDMEVRIRAAAVHDAETAAAAAVTAHEAGHPAPEAIADHMRAAAAALQAGGADVARVHAVLRAEIDARGAADASLARDRDADRAALAELARRVADDERDVLARVGDARVAAAAGSRAVQAAGDRRVADMVDRLAVLEQRMTAGERGLVEIKVAAREDRVAAGSAVVISGRDEFQDLATASDQGKDPLLAELDRVRLGKVAAVFDAAPAAHAAAAAPVSIGAVAAAPPTLSQHALHAALVDSALAHKNKPSTLPLSSTASSPPPDTSAPLSTTTTATSMTAKPTAVLPITTTSSSPAIPPAVPPAVPPPVKEKEKEQEKPGGPMFDPSGHPQPAPTLSSIGDKASNRPEGSGQ